MSLEFHLFRQALNTKQENGAGHERNMNIRSNLVPSTSRQREGAAEVGKARRQLAQSK